MTKLKPLATVLAFAVIASTATFAISQTAEARIKGPRAPGSMAYCGGLQDALDDIVGKMVKLSKAGKRHSAEYNALRQRGRDIMDIWNNSCRYSFGSPFYGPTPPDLLSYGNQAPDSTTGTIVQPDKSQRIPILKFKPMKQN